MEWSLLFFDVNFQTCFMERPSYGRRKHHALENIRTMGPQDWCSAKSSTNCIDVISKLISNTSELQDHIMKNPHVVFQFDISKSYINSYILNIDWFSRRSRNRFLVVRSFFGWLSRNFDPRIHHRINGHDSGTDWGRRYRFQRKKAYVLGLFFTEYPHKIWPEIWY